MIDIIKKSSPIELTDGQLGKMEAVCRFLLEKNKEMNLTAIRNEDEAAELHFVDSLYPLTVSRVRGKVLDVGSGGGFPAFPVAIASGLDVTCLDATKKKLDFIEDCAKYADVPNISVLYGRAEELGAMPAHRQKYGTVLSRGVARLNVLCEWCLPFVAVNGCFIAMKGASADEEAEEAMSAIEALGGSLVDIIKYTLPVSGHTHALVVIEKRTGTPAAYPRKNALILKNPL